MQEMQLQLKKFDITSIADDKVVVLIGKRDTGKSILVSDLLYYHKDIPIGTVISPTENANEFYCKMVPDVFIHDDITTELFANVLKRQKLIVKKKRKELKNIGKSKIDPRTFLILDDCLADNKSWINDPTIRALFYNGRHYKVLFIITCQYPLGLPPNFRTNIDYVFILRENLVANRKRIYDNYAGMFPSYEIFSQVMNQCTENYECLVIHNNAKSNKIEDQVFWYKAEIHESYKIGAHMFWEMQENMESSSDEEFFDTNFGRKKSKGPVVKVNKRTEYC